MRRYVILEHDHPHLHWDLMIEWGGHLKTWRLSAPPTRNESVPAEALADHRLMYLDYEGPVSGGRGHVIRWDSGHVTEVQQDEGALSFRLSGRRLNGTICLQSTADGAVICTYSDSAS
ncbi:MAG: hypothetical protein N2039_12485 [Gemmataceae bacterium]|nr:hypothetical protein [Gemmataceae bacterium]